MATNDFLDRKISAAKRILHADTHAALDKALRNLIEERGEELFQYSDGLTMLSPVRDFPWSARLRNVIEAFIAAQESVSFNSNINLSLKELFHLLPVANISKLRNIGSKSRDELVSAYIKYGLL